MRLVCPNCEAKYEVPEDAIPDSGRDVQCTNCGHTWFQMRAKSGSAPPETAAPAEPASDASAPSEEVSDNADSPALAAPEDAVTPETPESFLAAPTDPVAELVPEETPQAEDLPEGQLSAETAAETPADTWAQASDDAAVSPESEAVTELGGEPVQESLPETAVPAEPDPVTEAAQDLIAGAELQAEPQIEEAPVPDPIPEPVAETAPLADGVADAQPAAALDEPAAGQDVAPAEAAYAVDESVLAILREEAEREANARRSEALESQTDLGIDAAMPDKSRNSGMVAAKAAVAEAKPAARRDLLPDVEEINSTLRPSDAAVGDDATPDFVVPPPQVPHGFRSGFLMLMTVAILAAATYIVAPNLAGLLPALAGPLDTYVSIVDSLRLGLDGMMRSATVAISGS
jgi:resuscitation-promoting factor RpfA